MPADMDKLHELRPASLGRASRSRHSRDFLPDSWSRTAPVPSSGTAIQAARRAISEEDGLESPNVHRRSLSEGSSIEEERHNKAPHAEASATGEVEEGDIDVFASLPPISRSELGAISSRPVSPAGSHSRAKARLSTNDSIPIPGRSSTRGLKVCSSDYSPPRRGPRPEEIEAAKQILAEAERASFRAPRKTKKIPPESQRSATPPPISRSRNTVEDHVDVETQAVLGGSSRPQTPLNPSDEPLSKPRPRSASHQSNSTGRSRKVPFVLNKGMESRTSVLDQLQLTPELLLTPDASELTWSKSRKEVVGDINGVYGHQKYSYPKHGSSLAEAENAGQVVESGHLVADILDADHRPRTASQRTFSEDGHSTYRYSATPRQNLAGNGSVSRLPDFFSYGIFQTVLRDPATSRRLLQFSQARCCGENIEFLGKVDEYQKHLANLADNMSTIHKSFISDQSTSQLDLPISLMSSVNKEMKTVLGSSFLGMESIFNEMRGRIEDAVFTGVYPSFVRFQMTLSATRALANDRHRYQGLGDCFCLTDPNKADNPIVFASDGFVKVTGYTRPEIIPRNCRFLQGMQTDRVPVKRLKKGIAERKETVELILNYRKNGDPFWNLLYVTPLFNESGKLAFFLGGQVNCSTTIHSNADAMRVLSISGTQEPEEDAVSLPPQAPQRQSSLPSARKALLKAFGVRVEEPKNVRDQAGMEREVLGRMEGQNSQGQIKEFYTAYSKYLVVQANNFGIHFYSEGITEILNPANNEGLIAGQEVFRFFKQNMVNKESDYRARVRNAIRNGHPISVEIRLQTRRSARFRGDERFVTHWTPLKDDNGASHWVVVTLAPTIS